MRNWFTCKIRYFKMDEHGKAKRVTEPYLIDAMTYTEAEARIHSEIGAYVSNEFQIMNIAKSPLAEVFHYDDADVWYKAKVSYVDIDHDSGKEKKVSQHMIVTAHSVMQACERINESLSSMLVDFETESMSKTTIVEIFPYIPGEQVPEGFKPVAAMDSGTNLGRLTETMMAAANVGEALDEVAEKASRYTAPEDDGEGEEEEEAPIDEQTEDEEGEDEEVAAVLERQLDEEEVSEEVPAEEEASDDEDDDEDVDAIAGQLDD